MGGSWVLQCRASSSTGRVRGPAGGGGKRGVVVVRIAWLGLVGWGLKQHRPGAVVSGWVFPAWGYAVNTCGYVLVWVNPF